MATLKVSNVQLNALKDLIEGKKDLLVSNANYNLDYVKFMFHPSTPNIVILKMRTHGISGGEPFDDITYDFINDLGELVDFKLTFPSIQAWFQYSSEMKEFNIIDGQPVFVN